MAPKNNDKKKGKLSRYTYPIVKLSPDRRRGFKSHYTQSTALMGIESFFLRIIEANANGDI